MGGEVLVVVRRARAADAARRAGLVRHGFSSHLWDAFLYFFFQELTLECCVLGGAVLFIFCGVSAARTAALLPVAAAVVLAAVHVAARAFAEEQAQKMNVEMFGLVAEARGPLGAAGGARVRLHLDLDAPHCTHYTHVVGTASVAALRAGHGEHGEHGPHGGWLRALVVHPQWRRRGVGRALERGVRRAARAAGLAALEAAASDLQHAARALLHAQGWQCRGAGARPLCGAALALPVAHLACALGPPPPCSLYP